MEDYTLRLSENNTKAAALLEFLKSLDFIEINKTQDWWDDLSEEKKASVERGLNDYKSGRVFSDENVRNEVRQRILDATNK